MKEESFREKTIAEGYSPEEKYFYELNRDLIRNHKIQLELIKKNSKEMNCPRCETLLVESIEGGIRHLQCTQCHGVFLDGVDLEFFMKTDQPERLGEKMKKLFLPRNDYQIV